MFLCNKEFDLLNDVCFYLGELEGEKAQELYGDLSKLLDNMSNKRIEKNKLNYKRILAKRKLDKNYARTKFKNLGI